MEKLIFKTELTCEEFLTILQKFDDTDSNEAFLKMFGGHIEVTKKILEYYTLPENLESLNEYFEQIGDLIFGMGFDTYIETWKYWEDLLVKIPNHVLINWLLDFKPGKRNELDVDVALNWLLTNKFDGEITDKNFPELEELFSKTDIPKDLEKFIKEKHFINELELFEDIGFIYEEYTNNPLNQNISLKILKSIIQNRKLDSFHKLYIFNNLVKWYAPSKNISNIDKYKAFILEIFETDDGSGINMFSDEMFAIIEEEFSDIDFNNCSDYHKDIYQTKVKNEADHISKMNSEFPLYRHD